MYIKKLENYTNKNWYELKHELNLSHQDYIMLKQVLTSKTKKEIEKHFLFLEKVWIINWIWPWFFWKKIIKIISFLFKWVRFEWHDIRYFTGWNIKDKLKSDYWLLKYSFLSIRDKYKQINKLDLAFYSKALIIWAYNLSLIITIPIIVFCFIMVVLFWFTSFNYRKW